MSRNVTQGLLYIYNPHYGERVTVDDVLEIDPLIPISSDDTLVIHTRSPGTDEPIRISKPFQKKHVLRDIIPQELWPTFFQRTRSIQVRVSVKLEDLFCHSQWVSIELERRKKKAPKPAGRCYCQLPWESLRLGNLRATPCCHVIRRFRVPSHPQAGDYDPWNGDTMLRFRESLIEGRHKYCYHGCRHASVDKPMNIEENFSGDSLIRDNIDLARQEYLDGKVLLESKPIILALNLGTACNNYCRFCSIHETKHPFSISGQTLKLAKEYFPTAKRVTFTGGEPLLYAKKIRDIVTAYPDQEGKEVKFMTNGILVKECLDFLRGFSTLRLSVTLNAATADMYRNLHRTDHFHDVVEGIKLLKRAREGLATHIEVKMVIMRSTYQKIREFVALGADLGVTTVQFFDLRWYERLNMDRSEKLMPGDPAREEVYQAIQEARGFLKPHGIRIGQFVFDGRPDDLI